MKATQFFLFMGPKLWSFRRGETEYGVRAYPLGAFVRIIGMNNLDEVAPGGRTARLPQQELSATHAGHHGRVDHAHPHRHRADLRRLLRQRSARRDRSSGHRHRLRRAIRPIKPASRQATSSSPSTASSRRPQAIRRPDSHPSTRRVSHARARPTTAGRSPRLSGWVPTRRPVMTQAPRSSASSPALKSSGTTSRSRRPPATASSTSAPRSWQSISGVGTVLNPVNIVGHLTGSNDDLNTRPTTVVGISKLSDEIGDSIRLRRPAC